MTTTTPPETVRPASLRQAAEQGMNTIRSLIHTLENLDCDECYKAREEGRSAYVHTNEIKQARAAFKKLDDALNDAP